MLDPHFPCNSSCSCKQNHAPHVNDVYEKIMKQQRKRKRRVYALLWGLSILAVVAGAVAGYYF